MAVYHSSATERSEGHHKIRSCDTYQPAKISFENKIIVAEKKEKIKCYFTCMPQFFDDVQKSHEQFAASWRVL